MKMTEFYEKYWKIVTKDGLIDVPKLPEEEKLVWDLAEEMGISPYVNFWSRVRGRVWVINPKIKQRIEELKSKQYNQ